MLQMAEVTFEQIGFLLPGAGFLPDRYSFQTTGLFFPPVLFDCYIVKVHCKIFSALNLFMLYFHKTID
jgi:hypothetical protein